MTIDLTAFIHKLAPQTKKKITMDMQKKTIIASPSRRKPPTNCPDAFLQCIDLVEEDDIDDIEIGANTDISDHDEGILVRAVVILT